MSEANLRGAPIFAPAPVGFARSAGYLSSKRGLMGMLIAGHGCDCQVIAVNAAPRLDQVPAPTDAGGILAVIEATRQTQSRRHGVARAAALLRQAILV